jgi:hypothetical protein
MIFSLALSKNGLLLLSASLDRTVKTWILKEVLRIQPRKLDYCKQIIFINLFD